MTDPIPNIADALALDEAELRDLVDQAACDPPPGCPLRIMRQGREIEIEPGQWLPHADRWTRLPPDCPVIPLGFEGDTFYFLNPVGQVAFLKANSSGKGPIGALFAGRSRYLEWAWPRFGKAPKGGGRGEVVGWEADDARQALMDACAFVGTFNDADMVRGRGAWTDQKGALVFHAGDRVWIDGRWHPPGRHGPWVYAARPAIEPPTRETIEAGPDGPAQMLREVYSSWCWRRPEVDPHLLLGFTCMAMIGGAPDWRPMVFITAEKGSGKSTLQKVMAAAHGRGMIQSVNTTGPGLYQKLKHDSLPVLIDELENQAGSPAKIAAIIELIRTASSGGKINRGSSEGQAREYECRSPFVCTSINIPPLRPQDQSRFAILNLDKFTEAKAEVGFDFQEIEGWGRMILRRMIDGWPRWARTLTAYKKALIEQGGHDARGADQFGGLIAAAWIAERDGDPDEATLARWAGLLKASGMAETADTGDDWRDCLNHLTDVVPEAYRAKTDGNPTLGARLAAFRKTAAAEEDLQRFCNQVGLAMSYPKHDDQGRPVLPDWSTARLFIPAKGPEVRKLFAGTTWEGVPGATGVWHTTLQRAPADMIWRGTCGKGLDAKRKGLFVDLAKAFPAGPDGDDD